MGAGNFLTETGNSPAETGKFGAEQGIGFVSKSRQFRWR